MQKSHRILIEWGNSMNRSVPLRPVFTLDPSASCSLPVSICPEAEPLNRRGNPLETRYPFPAPRRLYDLELIHDCDL